MQDGLGNDTCWCAAGNGGRLTNGWTDGCSGTDTNSLGNGFVIRGYHYQQRTADNCQQLLSLGLHKTRDKHFFSNYELALNLYRTIQLYINLPYKTFKMTHGDYFMPD